MTKLQKPDFFRDTNGNLSIITGVVGLLLLTAVGASLDGGRMFTTKQNLQSITDAAALMAATPEGVSSDRRRSLAQTSIDSHVQRAGDLDISATTITVNEADGQVYVELTAEVPMLFAGVLGGNLRQVSASSLAEESMATTMNPLSISLVLDLSDSMGDSFDNGSKLASVNAAMSDVMNSINAEFGGDVAAATNISTGVYPFNWGMVDGETVALEPGTNVVLDSLNYLSVGDGSVPTTAMERAVQDQLDEMSTRRNRDRFIVYVTDGKVDEDRSDVAGRYLRASELFRNQDDNGCQRIAQELAVLDTTFGANLVENSGAGSALRVTLPDVNLPNQGDGRKKNKLFKDIRKLQEKRARSGGNGNGLAVGLNTGNGNGLAVGLGGNGDNDESEMEDKLKDDKHAGHNHGNDDVRDMAKRLEYREEFLELCEPVQPLRVAEACETARESGISIIAINLSGQDQIASNTTDMCVNGIVTEEEKGKKRRGETTDERTASDVQPLTLPSGIQVRVSADGRSYAGDANNLDELRDMLSVMLPDSDRERVVRLVG